jgi:hypothetical protein
VVAGVIELREYAKPTKIKMDRITVPINKGANGKPMGLMQKVRLSIKMTRCENFKELI